MKIQKNLSIVFLLVVYFFIYTSFLYVQLYILSNSMKCSYANSRNIILICVESSSVLLVGILATFVFPVFLLLFFSLSMLIIGVSFLMAGAFLQYRCDLCYLIKDLELSGIIMFAMFYGTFRFIFLSIILDKNQSQFIKRKIIGWLGVENLSYIIVNIIPSQKYSNYLILFPISCFIIGIILFVYGKYKKIYVINADIVNVVDIMKSSRRKKSQGRILNVSQNKKSERDVISISTSIIFFICLIPYGICDSQTRYAYEYQSNHMKIPVWSGFLSFLTKRSNFWPIFLNCLTVFLAFLVFILLKTMNKFQFIKSLYSSIKVQIIVGNILMILSSLIGGIVENFRLLIYWNWNLDAKIPSKDSFNQTIGNVTYKAADLTVFVMVPQIVLDGISEVIIITSCLEFMYKQSETSVKYLSIALFLAAIGSGGLSDLFFIILTSVNKSFKNDLNNYHLDHIYFILAGVALLSWIISMILINRYPYRFRIIPPKNYNTFVNDGN